MPQFDFATFGQHVFFVSLASFLFYHLYLRNMFVQYMEVKKMRKELKKMNEELEKDLKKKDKIHNHFL
jgi:hypothetical protein